MWTIIYESLNTVPGIGLFLSAGFSLLPVSCYIILTLVGRIVTALHDFTVPPTYSTMDSFSRYLVKTIFTEHLLQCTKRKYTMDSNPYQAHGIPVSVPSPLGLSNKVG